MRLVAIVAGLVFMLSGVCAFAGVKKVPSHLDKNGKYVHGHIATTQSLADTNPKYWIKFESKQANRKPRYSNVVPFTQIYVPPTEGKLEFYDAPEMENYTNDPFDTN